MFGEVTSPVGGGIAKSISNGKVFIVHVHDKEMKETVARFIESQGLEAVILHEQPDGGLTIIEKFESHASDVGFAIVLFSADDFAKVGTNTDGSTVLKGRP